MNISPYYFGMPWSTGKGYVVILTEEGTYGVQEKSQEEVRAIGDSMAVFNYETGALAYANAMNSPDEYAPKIAAELGKAGTMDARTQIATALFAGMLPKGIGGVGPGKFDIMRAAAIRQADLLLLDLLTTDPCANKQDQ